MTTKTPTTTYSPRSVRVGDDTWHRLRVGALKRRMAIGEYLDHLLDADGEPVSNTPR